MTIPGIIGQQGPKFTLLKAGNDGNGVVYATITLDRPQEEIEYGWNKIDNTEPDINNELVPDVLGFRFISPMSWYAAGDATLIKNINQIINWPHQVNCYPYADFNWFFEAIITDIDDDRNDYYGFQVRSKKLIKEKPDVDKMFYGSVEIGVFS